MSAGIRCVLFDLDGTFADTAPDLGNALNRTLEKHGQRPMPLAEIRPHVSHGGAALIRLGFGEQLDESVAETYRQDLLDFYLQDICRDTCLFPGIEQLVDDLEQQNIRWGIVTNKPAFLTDPLMLKLGYQHRAACIVSGDTTSQRKPHPESILLACKLAQRQPAESLYVGDAQRDIEAGNRAGTLTLTALFGYIGQHERPLEWNADGAIEHPSEILNWL